jgi:hypothetical protein
MYQWLLPSAGGETSSATFLRYIEDGDRLSKARRRLGNDKGLLLVAQGAATAYNFHIHIRALIKE